MNTFNEHRDLKILLASAGLLLTVVIVSGAFELSRIAVHDVSLQVLHEETLTEEELFARQFEVLVEQDAHNRVPYTDEEANSRFEEIRAVDAAAQVIATEDEFRAKFEEIRASESRE